MVLKENERLDDLQWKDLKIIQKETAFCFGIDAVLLSYFASKIKPQSTVVDLCTGNGIVAILLASRVNVKHIYGVEIQEEIADMAKRSVAYNKQESQITILQEDLKNVSAYFTKGSMDAVTVNPPYKKAGSGIHNQRDCKSISRHEVLCTLEDVIHQASWLLNTNGALYMVHRTERLVDVLTLMRQEKLEPKRIQFVHPSSTKAPNLFLVEGIKNAKPFLKVEDPIIVYDEKGEYSCTIQEIYRINEER